MNGGSFVPTLVVLHDPSMTPALERLREMRVGTEAPFALAMPDDVDPLALRSVMADVAAGDRYVVIHLVGAFEDPFLELDRDAAFGAVPANAPTAESVAASVEDVRQKIEVTYPAARGLQQWIVHAVGQDWNDSESDLSALVVAANAGERSVNPVAPVTVGLIVTATSIEASVACTAQEQRSMAADIAYVLTNSEMGAQLLDARRYLWAASVSSVAYRQRYLVGSLGAGLAVDLLDSETLDRDGEPDDRSSVSADASAWLRFLGWGDIPDDEPPAGVAAPRDTPSKSGAPITRTEVVGGNVRFCAEDYLFIDSGKPPLDRRIDPDSDARGRQLLNGGIRLGNWADLLASWYEETSRNELPKLRESVRKTGGRIERERRRDLDRRLTGAFDRTGRLADVVAELRGLRDGLERTIADLERCVRDFEHVDVDGPVRALMVSCRRLPFGSAVAARLAVFAGVVLALAAPMLGAFGSPNGLSGHVWSRLMVALVIVVGWGIYAYAVLRAYSRWATAKAAVGADLRARLARMCVEERLRIARELFNALGDGQLHRPGCSDEQVSASAYLCILREHLVEARELLQERSRRSEPRQLHPTRFALTVPSIDDFKESEFGREIGARPPPFERDVRFAVLPLDTILLGPDTAPVRSAEDLAAAILSAIDRRVAPALPQDLAEVCRQVPNSAREVRRVLSTETAPAVLEGDRRSTDSKQVRRYVFGPSALRPQQPKTGPAASALVEVENVLDSGGQVDSLQALDDNTAARVHFYSVEHVAPTSGDSGQVDDA